MVIMNKTNPVKRGEILDIYVDGASRGNPGPSAWAYIFKVNGKLITSRSDYIGFSTNNEAEYHAVINALSDAKGYTRWDVKIYSDSELVVKHLIGEYRVKAPNLAPLCQKIFNLQHFFKKVEYFHMGRNHQIISECDDICNNCLDEKGF